MQKKQIKKNVNSFPKAKEHSLVSKKAELGKKKIEIIFIITEKINKAQDLTVIDKINI